MNLARRIVLMIRTGRHLRPIQFVFLAKSIVRRLLPPGRISRGTGLPGKRGRSLDLIPCIPGEGWESGTTFTFLNGSQSFQGTVDWSWQGYGRLWNQHLNALGFLTQRGLPLSLGLDFLRSFMVQKDFPVESMHPYVISLRVMNIIKFVTRWGNEISAEASEMISGFVSDQVRFLRRNLEYRLLGNHLLTNVAALLFASVWLEDRRLFRKAERILKKQTAQQLFPDGGHVERSPMYHSLMLVLILDCYNLLCHNRVFETTLDEQLADCARRMMSWMNAMLLENGTLPPLNDSACDVAPAPAQIMGYARRLLKEIPHEGELRTSGFRRIRRGNYELAICAGTVSPSYNPGHSHCDIGAFELYVDSRPLLVDTGISTYEHAAIRMYERSTAAHNTVKVAGREQHEIWDRFRIARRGRVEVEDGPARIIVRGYPYQKGRCVVHQRRFSFFDSAIAIHDVARCRKPQFCQAFFHFAPSLAPERTGDGVSVGNVFISFSGAEDIRLTAGYRALQFNLRVKNYSMEVCFSSHSGLTTWITIQHQNRVSG